MLQNTGVGTMSRTGHHRYRVRRQKLKSSTRNHLCHLCGDPIDLSLPYPHPGSWSADHLIPVSLGGSNDGELRSAHLFCNQSRGNRKGLSQQTESEKEKGKEKEEASVRHVLEWR